MLVTSGHIRKFLSWVASLAQPIDKDVGFKLKGFTRDIDAFRRELLSASQTANLLATASAFIDTAGEAGTKAKLAVALDDLSGEKVADSDTGVALASARLVLLKGFAERCQAGHKPVLVADDVKMLLALRSTLPSEAPASTPKGTTKSPSLIQQAEDTVEVINVGARLVDLLARVEEFAAKPDAADASVKFDAFMAYMNQEAIFVNHRLVHSSPEDHMDCEFLTSWAASVTARVEEQRQSSLVTLKNSVGSQMSTDILACRSKIAHSLICGTLQLARHPLFP